MENLRLFGTHPEDLGQGYNYILEAFVTGKPHPLTGMVINLKDLDNIIKELLTPLDHHHLNQDVPYFKNTLPSCENIAKYCFEYLKQMLTPNPQVQLTKVRIYEGDLKWADYGQLK